MTDAALAAEVFADPAAFVVSGGTHWSPEQALCAAILVRAALDLRGGLQAGEKRAEGVAVTQRRARVWIASDAEPFPHFGFVTCCRALGVQPWWLRARLRVQAVPARKPPRIVHQDGARRLHMQEAIA